MKQSVKVIGFKTSLWPSHSLQDKASISCSLASTICGVSNPKARIRRGDRSPRLYKETISSQFEASVAVLRFGRV